MKERRVWESSKDEAADDDCMYGGEVEGCSHYTLSWYQKLENGSMGGNIGGSSKKIIDFLAAAANAAEEKTE